MTKAELAKMFSEATELNQLEAKEYLERLGDIMAAELIGGGEVVLPRIGKLAVKKTAPRKRRNPKTGADVHVPAGRKIVLRVGKELKDALK